MSQTALQQTKDQNKILEQVITKGDLADLTPEQKVSYYNAVCHSLQLNPLTKPFDFLEVFDKETNKTKVVLYANKDCAWQLKDRDKVSIYKLEEVTEDGYLKITVYARTPDGQIDIDKSVTFIKGLLGKSYENAYKKAVTQAKRRVTLSICGLGFLDESEIDSIPNAQSLPSPEQDAVMTDQEADQLTLSYKASGLDQWKCGRGLAMQLIKVCQELKAKGVDNETMRARLPGGVQSRKDLTPDQAKEAIKAFAHWLKTYEEVVEGGVINNG